MKYTIEGFNQAAMVQLGFDAVDAIILRWFVDFYGTNKMKNVLDGDKEYKWVKYQAVIDDLPILGINNKENIARRFGKFESTLVLEKYIKKSQKGTYSCFRPGENYSPLIESSDESCTRLKSRVQSTPNSKVECAPDSKVEPKDYSITNSSTIVSKDTITFPEGNDIDSGSFSTKQIKNSRKIIKEPIPDHLIQYIPILEYWNTRLNIKHPHKFSLDAATKTVLNALRLLHLLCMGTFAKMYDLAPDYVSDFGIGQSDVNRAYSQEEILTMIDRHDKMCSPDYHPKIKCKFPKSLQEFLYNYQTKRSFFFSHVANKNAPRVLKEKPKYEPAIAMYKNAFLKGKLNETEERELISAVNFVVDRKKDYEKKIGQYLHQSKIKDDAWYKYHIYFITERYFDAGVFDISKIKNQSYWSKFILWMKSVHHINLEPSQDEVNKARESHNQKVVQLSEEQKRREEEDRERQKTVNRGPAKEGIRARCQEG